MSIVSCIMPTYNRQLFVAQSIAYFLRQDYPDKELIVVDDGENSVMDLIPDDPAVRYIRLDKRLSLGAKRNLACEMSRGEWIAHWDDDDWMSPRRLSLQVAHLQKTGAAVCGTKDLFYFRTFGGDAWFYSSRNSERPYLLGCTLFYRRSVWIMHTFPDVDIGEDYLFQRSIPPSQLSAIQETDWYVAVIHGNNAAAKNLADPRWQRRSLDEISRLLGPDRSFYVAIRNGLPPPRPTYKTLPTKKTSGPSGNVRVSTQGPQDRSLPLISCIMPTYNRRQFVPQTIKYFQQQDYPHRELIVIDDGTDPVRDLIPDDDRIHYIRLPGRHTIGVKRNVACDAAKGKIIALWDDDDWYARHRLSYQVAPLLEGCADITGLDKGLLLSLPTMQFWDCNPEVHKRMFYQEVVGGTLLFWKKYYTNGIQFPNTSLAEDAQYLQLLLQLGARLKRLANQNIFIYIRHTSNSWEFTPGKFLDSRGWRQVGAPSCLTDSELEFYRIRV